MLSHHPGYSMAIAMAVVLSFGVMLLQGPAEVERAASRVDRRAEQAFQIAYPVDGSIVSQRSVTVYGSALPGTMVRLGRKNVRTSGEGKWSLAVILQRGENRLAFRIRDKKGELILRTLTLNV